MEQRGPNSAYASRQPAVNYASGYLHEPHSAPSSSVSEYSFKHQRTQSSSTTSPYVSPRTEMPGYSSSAPNPFYQQQQQGREPIYAYQSSQPTDFQPRQAQHLAQPVVPFRQQQSASQPQPGDHTAYQRAPDIDNHSSLQYRNQPASLSTQPVYYPTTSLLSFPERSTDIVQSRTQPLQPPLPNVLPPLESTVTPGHARGLLPQARNDYIIPVTEAHAFMPMTNQTSSERAQESYAVQAADYTTTAHLKRDNG